MRLSIGRTMRDAFDVVPARADHKRAIVIGMIRFPDARRTIVFRTSFQRRRVKRIDLSAILRTQGQMIPQNLHIIADGLSILVAGDPQPGTVFAEPDDTGCDAGEFFQAEVAEGGDEEADFVIELAEGDGIGEVVKRHGGVLVEELRCMNLSWQMVVWSCCDVGDRE